MQKSAVIRNLTLFQGKEELKQESKQQTHKYITLQGIHSHLRTIQLCFVSTHHHQLLIFKRLVSDKPC